MVRKKVTTDEKIENALAKSEYKSAAKPIDWKFIALITSILVATGSMLGIPRLGDIPTKAECKEERAENQVHNEKERMHLWRVIKVNQDAIKANQAHLEKEHDATEKKLTTINSTMLTILRELR